MATKARKTKKTSKRRLALPSNIAKNIEEARKNIKTYQGKSLKEMEKIYNKVIEIDFVKKVRKNEMVKKATKQANKTKDDIHKNVESRFKKYNKRFKKEFKNFRHYLPVPTRTELNDLSKKVDRLTKKVDEIAGKTTRRSSAASNS